MSILKFLFPTQTRESQLEETTQICFRAIKDNVNEYTPTEQVIIIKKLQEKFNQSVKNEVENLEEQLNEFKHLLGYI